MHTSKYPYKSNLFLPSVFVYLHYKQLLFLHHNIRRHVMLEVEVYNREMNMSLEALAWPNLRALRYKTILETFTGAQVISLWENSSTMEWAVITWEQIKKQHCPCLEMGTGDQCASNCLVLKIVLLFNTPTVCVQSPWGLADTHYPLWCNKLCVCDMCCIKMFPRRM